MKRIDYLTVIRVVSCVAIVILHTFFLAVSGFGTSVRQNVASMFVRNGLLWAVPCFVMVTGALLLDPAREVTVPKVLKKYLPRPVIAIFACTLVFAVFDSLVTGGPRGAALILDWLGKVWRGGSWAHMWYLYLLIGLYLMLPLYRLVTERDDDRLLRYVLIVFFVFLSVIPSVGYLSGTTSGLYILSYTVYPLYMFLGYALHTEKLKIPVPAAAALFAAGTALLLILTYYGIVKDSSAFRQASGSFAFFGVAMQAAGIFSVIRHVVTSRSGILPAMWNRIDRASFGIYLLHLIPIQVFYRVLRLDPYRSGGGTGIMAVIALISFFAAWALAHCIRKIPRVGKYI